HRGLVRALAERGRVHVGDHPLGPDLGRPGSRVGRASIGYEPPADPAQGRRAAGRAHRHPSDRQRVHHAAEAHVARIRDLAARTADGGAGALVRDLPVSGAAPRGARLLPRDRQHPDGRPVAARAPVYVDVAQASPAARSGPGRARGLTRRALMSDVVLRAEGVRKHYGELEVLKGVSFEVDRGEVKVIIGPSGSGKSTLLRCLAMLEAPDAGDVYLE